MIVPRQRLLWIVALSGIPLLSLVGIMPNEAWLFFSLLFCLALVLALDAQLSRGLLTHVKASLPNRSNLFKGRESGLPLQIDRGEGHVKHLRAGLNLPPDQHPLDPQSHAGPDERLSETALRCPLSRRSVACRQFPSQRLHIVCDHARIRIGGNVRPRVHPGIAADA